MPLAVGDVVSVAYRSIWALQKILLTLTYRVSLATSTQSVSQDLFDIADFFADVVGGSPRANYLAVLGSNVEIQDARAQRVWPLRSLYRTSPIFANGAGGTNAETGNIAAVVTLRTDVAGRSQVANKHIGPIPFASFEAGAPSAGLRAGLDALGDNLILGKTVPLNDTNQLSLSPVIYHSALGQNSAITNHIVGDRIGTMYRRTLRVGE